MGIWLRGGVGLGLALLALGAAGPVAAASGAPAPPITVHLTLRTDHVVAGHRIKGTVALTNTTHEAITVNTCAIDGWLDVGLKSRSYSPTFAHPLVGCAPSVRIRPGTTRYPVTVVTTYGGCSQPEPSGTPPSALPICTVSDGREGPPPLPAGHYATVVEFVGLTGLAQTPGRATVTLEAPAKPPELAPCAETSTTAPTLVTVPDVVGQSSSAAAFAFARACLDAAWTNPVGTRVVSESPSASSKVPEYSTVTLTTR
jgi:hypothetical protein